MMNQCKNCNFYNHNLNEEGICINCKTSQEHSLCPECKVYLLKPGNICPHHKVGLEETIQHEKEKTELLVSLSEPVKEYSEHFKAIFHYYGMIYNGIGPVKSYISHLNAYNSSNNIPSKAVDKIIDVYHAMFGC